VTRGADARAVDAVHHTGPFEPQSKVIFEDSVNFLR